MKRSKIIFVDMDEVIADFSGSPDLKHGNRVYGPAEMYVPGFFRNLAVKPGAIKNVMKLIKDGHNVEILTQPVEDSPVSYLEKSQWILMHFPTLKGKIHMTQNKGRFIGDYLIDDNLKWKEPFEKNGGKFLHFNLEFESEDMWEIIYDLIQSDEALNESNDKAATDV